MKITMEFNSWEEMNAWLAEQVNQILQQNGYPKTAKARTTAGKAPKAETAPAPAEYPDPDPAEPEADPTPAPAPKQEKPAAKVDESYRVEVRKTLAALNKKTGENTASQLIKGYGVDKLTEVPLDKLQDLMEKAMARLQEEA
jgi:hypothetical protein